MSIWVVVLDLILSCKNQMLRLNPPVLVRKTEIVVSFWAVSLEF